MTTHNHPMPVIVLFLLSLLATSCQEKPAAEREEQAIAPATFAAYNHTALVVSNLDTSVAFYQQLFQFDSLPYPFPPREGIRSTWLRMGENAELHLAQLEGEQPDPYAPGHLGIMVSSMDTLLDRLYAISPAYTEGKETPPVLDTMPYGARTTMIKDPDGYLIHIIESLP